MHASEAALLCLDGESLRVSDLTRRLADELRLLGSVLLDEGSFARLVIKKVLVGRATISCE